MNLRIRRRSLVHCCCSLTDPSSSLLSRALPLDPGSCFVVMSVISQAAVITAVRSVIIAAFFRGMRMTGRLTRRGIDDYSSRSRCTYCNAADGLKEWTNGWSRLSEGDGAGGYGQGEANGE